MATDVTFTGTGDQKITVDTPTVSVFPANVTISNPTVTTKAETKIGGGVAGGYFGVLEFTEKLVYKMTGNIDDEVNVTSDGKGEAYGALIGNVINNTIQASLLVKGYEINSNNNQSQRFYFHGGLIGELGAQGNKDKGSLFEH